MRVGFFGGSFDPPHRGHVAVAKASADAFELGTVLFAPTGRQPLKPGGAQASFAHRLAMVGLLSGMDERFSPSELDRPLTDGGPNYTVAALESLARSSAGAEIYSLIGADSFQDFPRWRDADRLLELSEWIVISRPGFVLTPSAGYPLTPERMQRVHVLNTVQEDVSATEIRRRLSVGDRCAGLLTAPVADYIAKQGLYRFPPEPGLK